ncbi:MAG TPA: VOC family protein [Chloroflexota bacterium]|nr:VOC family protein [Chloroflexota bacterium]
MAGTAEADTPRGRVDPIPEGYHTITPSLTLSDAGAAIEFYKRAFGAEELGRMPSPDGKVLHAELKIGDSRIMLADEFPDMGSCRAPQSLGGTSISLHIYVEDVDTAFQRAVEAGATVTMPVQDTFWGDRYGSLVDPFGHAWSLATHKEDLTPEETQRRMQASFSQVGG